MEYSLRFYRDWAKRDDLTSFEVKLRETDLAIRAHSDLSAEAMDMVRRRRRDLEVYAEAHPGFFWAMTPRRLDPEAPEIVREMIEAAALYGVGPMAAVAGAMAEAVGRGLLEFSPEVIVENGGDVFLRMNRPARLMLYSGEASPFGGKLVVKIDAPGEPRGVCTSSARIGPSVSHGAADAVLAVSDRAALADAAATAIGNRVKTADDVAGVLEEEKSRGVLLGAVVTIGETFGAFGELELEEI
ncbi:MAG TPA: UPF0280 family protein [Planctomycetota bacterium]|nr:UPF0280 family protein [Planctomycetota bacterium]